MSSIVDVVMGVVGFILYPLFIVVFNVIDGLYDIFKAFAGVGPSSFGAGFGTGSTEIGAGNTGELTDTGILYYLLQHDIVKNLLISIMLLGLFLLIIFTVMAFIKNAYAAKPKTWQEIIASALKGLANFVVLPVACLLGVWAGNILLNAIDGATAGSSTQLTMAGRLFKAAAYDANEIRVENDKEKALIAWNDLNSFAGDKEAKDIGFFFDLGTPPTDAQTITDEQMEYIANKLDESYASRACKLHQIDNYTKVNNFYKPFAINYIVLLVGGFFMCYVLVSLAYGMIRRMFFIVILFVISPGLCSLYPLDDGKATSSWKSDFQKNVISAYGAIAGMNLFFAILPLLLQVKLVGNAGAMLNGMGITELIIMICGLMLVKEFISKIVGYIGAEDAFSQGASLRSSVRSKTKDQIKNAKGKIKATGAFASKIGSTAGKLKGTLDAGGWKGLGRSLGSSVLKDGLGFDVRGSYKKSHDEAKEAEDKRLKTKHDKAKMEDKFINSGAKGYLDTHTGKLDDAQINELLSKAGTDDKLKEFIAGKIAKRDALHTDTYVNSKGKSHGYRYNPTAEDVIKGDEKYTKSIDTTARAKLAQDEYDKNATERKSQQTVLWNSARDLISEISGSVYAHGIDVSNMFMADGKINKESEGFRQYSELTDKDRMNDLRRKAESGVAGAQEQYNELKSLMALVNQHEKEEGKMDKITDKLEASAQKVASTLEAAAEYQKDEVKQGMIEAAEKLKTKIESTTQTFKEKLTDVGDIITDDVKEAFKKIKDEIKDAAEELNRKRSGTP